MTNQRRRIARPRAQLVAGRADWYKITNNADTAVVLIYDEIGWFGTDGDDFVRDLDAMQAAADAAVERFGETWTRRPGRPKKTA